jgi:hypothetical protein
MGLLQPFKDKLSEMVVFKNIDFNSTNSNLNSKLLNAMPSLKKLPSSNTARFPSLKRRSLSSKKNGKKSPSKIAFSKNV